MSGAEITAVMANLEKLTAEIHGKLDEKLFRITKDIEARASEKAPKDTGTLSKSGDIKPLTDNADSIGFRLTFDEIYARIQHERTDFYHKDGECKYLEKAVNEKKEAIREQIADGLL